VKPVQWRRKSCINTVRASRRALGALRRICERIGGGLLGGVNHFSLSRRKPGSILPPAVNQPIVMPYQRVAGSCNGAMGPGFRRGGGEMTGGGILHNLGA
jgi:hypothetical protein